MAAAAEGEEPNLPEVQHSTAARGSPLRFSSSPSSSRFVAGAGSGGESWNVDGEFSMQDFSFIQPCGEWVRVTCLISVSV